MSQMTSAAALASFSFASTVMDVSPLAYRYPQAQRQAFASTEIITCYDDPQQERQQLGQCALLDLTPLARVGLRGRQAADYLNARQYQLPQAPNQALGQSDGSAILRLSQTEYFLLGSLGDLGQRIRAEESAWSLSDESVYLLPRQDSHAWLLLTGSHVAEVMAKLCGVDLRAEAFPPGSVAQTSAARINVIVANLGSEQLPCFHLLCDRASLNYFWDAVLDAMEEFGGMPVGIDALR